MAVLNCEFKYTSGETASNLDHNRKLLGSKRLLTVTSRPLMTARRRKKCAL